LEKLVEFNTEKLLGVISLMTNGVVKGTVSSESVRIVNVGSEFTFHSYNSNFHLVYKFPKEDLTYFSGGIDNVISIERLKVICSSATSDTITIQMDNKVPIFFIPQKRQLLSMDMETANFKDYKELPVASSFLKEYKETINYLEFNKTTNKLKKVVSLPYFESLYQYIYFNGVFFSTIDRNLISSVVFNLDFKHKFVIPTKLVPILNTLTEEKDIYFSEDLVYINNGNLDIYIVLVQDIDNFNIDIKADNWNQKFIHEEKITINKTEMINALTKISYFVGINDFDKRFILEYKNNKLFVKVEKEDFVEDEIKITTDIKEDFKKFYSLPNMLIFLENLPEEKVTLGIYTKNSSNSVEGLTYSSDKERHVIIETLEY